MHINQKDVTKIIDEIKDYKLDVAVYSILLSSIRLIKWLNFPDDIHFIKCYELLEKGKGDNILYCYFIDVIDN